MKPRPLSAAASLISIVALFGLSANSAPTLAQSMPAPGQVHPGLFSNMFVYGDSFSDGGNFALAVGFPEISRFTTNPGHVAVENIARDFGLPLLPSIQGGSNYAVAYAGMGDNPPDTPPFVTSLPQQLEASLAPTGGTADPNALYTIVGGSNDVFAAFSLAGNGDISPDQAQSLIDSAVQAELGMIQRLDQAGARYVMVFNLPDLGLSPDIAALGPEVSGPLTGMTVAFNQALSTGLAQAKVNIIPVNMFALFNEFVAHPADFGFSNVSTPACGMEAVSIDCGAPGSGATWTYPSGSESTHLFADFAHPSSAAHAMLAQYAESIILAPGQISLLGEAPLATVTMLDRSVYHRAASRARDTEPGGWQIWTDFGSTHQRQDAQVNAPDGRSSFDQLSMGVDVQTKPTLTAGLVLTATRQESVLAGNAGGHDLDELMVTGYAAWRWQHGFLNASASIGDIDFNRVQRDIAIGPSLRHERGETSGSHAAAHLGGGWLFDLGNWRTGPFAAMGWQQIRIDGYTETGNDAATMVFGEQHRRALISTLGWQLDGTVQTGTVALHPYARLAWHTDHEAEARAVRAGLVSMGGSFALPGFLPDRNWATATMGLNLDISSRLSAWLGYEARRADSSQAFNSINRGASWRF